MGHCGLSDVNPLLNIHRTKAVALSIEHPPRSRRVARILRRVGSAIACRNRFNDCSVWVIRRSTPFGTIAARFMFVDVAALIVNQGLRCFKRKGRDQESGMLFEGNERRDRERAMRDAGRLPPGQSLTLKWPVLHYGSVPKFDPEQWDFRAYGLVDNPVRLNWVEFGQLPRSEHVTDFHCVTRWSRLKTTGAVWRLEICSP